MRLSRPRRAGQLQQFVQDFPQYRHPATKEGTTANEHKFLRREARNTHWLLSPFKHPIATGINLALPIRLGQIDANHENQQGFSRVVRGVRMLFEPRPEVFLQSHDDDDN